MPIPHWQIRPDYFKDIPNALTGKKKSVQRHLVQDVAGKFNYHRIRKSGLAQYYAPAISLNFTLAFLLLGEVFDLDTLLHTKRDLVDLLLRVELWNKDNKEIQHYRVSTLPWCNQCHEWEQSLNLKSQLQFRKNILCKTNQVKMKPQTTFARYNFQSTANQGKCHFPIRCQINVKWEEPIFAMKRDVISTYLNWCL